MPENLTESPTLKDDIVDTTNRLQRMLCHGQHVLGMTDLHSARRCPQARDAGN